MSKAILSSKKTVEEFLEAIPSEGTRRTYRCALKFYFNHLETEPDKYFDTARNYADDVESFFVKLSENSRPPLTVRTYLAAVKAYLLENDIELPQRFWKKISGRIKGKKARTQDTVPDTPDTIRKLFSHMDLKARALFMVMESSGMRIGEALKITFNDIDLKQNPARIYVKGEYTKNGDPRTCFISGESKEIVVEWLKVRSAWLKGCIDKAKNLERDSEEKGRITKGSIFKTLDDKRLFPITPSVAIKLWNHALEKAGLVKRDSSTNRRTLHPHILRKYFRSRLGKVNHDIAEVLMGHSGYLGNTYRRYSETELAKFYLEYEHLLFIFTDQGEITRRFKDVNTEIDSQRRVIDTLTLERSDLQNQFSKLEERFGKFEKYVLEFADYSREDFEHFFELVNKKRQQDAMERDAEVLEEDKKLVEGLKEEAKQTP